MPTTTFETAISHFFSLGRAFQATESLTSEQVLNELSAWYRDYRIEGAVLDEDADMLSFQWGATRPLLVAEPIDLRGRGNDNLAFAAQEMRYLDFTRQVFAISADEEAEFDDTAVQMSVTLSFQSADGTEPNANLWIQTPDNLNSAVAEFRSIPFVQSYLQMPAHLVSITVDRCG